MIEQGPRERTKRRAAQGRGRGRSSFAGRGFALTAAGLLAWPMSGCLIFTDFSRGSERDAAVPEVTPPRRSCEQDDFVCFVGAEGEPDRWRECGETGDWLEPVDCPRPMPYCNAEARGCVACRAGAGRCDGSRFFACDEQGTERFVADCAATDQICDFESSGLGCIDCLPGQTRCGGSELLVCNRGFEFEAQPCIEEAGCITHATQPGQLDYCAECSRPEEHYCESDRHYRCDAEYGKELVEDCRSIGSDCIPLSDAGATCE